MSPSKTNDAPSAADPQAYDDLEALCRLVSEGKPVSDPGLIRRVEERADAAREEALRRFGVQEVSVDLVRELRDPEA